MKILIVYRTNKDKTWKAVDNMGKKLTELGHKVDFLSREEDLNMNSLSSSMGNLSSIIEKRVRENNYDRIYTQDWSIAFPLLIPNKVLPEKHYCLFHDIEPSGAKSRILQRIAGNMMGNKLVVKTVDLKKKFSKATLSPDGISKEMLK